MNSQLAVGFLRTLWQLQEHDRWTRHELERYQIYALQKLRAYVYTHSRFYQQFHQGLENRPLQDLPILTKALAMECFDTLVTDPSIHLEAVRNHLGILQGDELFLGQYRVMATSGSTGQPGIFLFNRTEWTTLLASFGHASVWAGRQGYLVGAKTAYITSTAPWHLSTRLSISIQTRWTPTIGLDPTEPLDFIIQRLNTWQPHILVAYASMAHLLAEKQLAGHLHIAPRCVFTSAEVLTEQGRQRIKQAWKPIMCNEYALTEGGCLAAERPGHQGLHLMEDLVILENVDAQNRPVPAGVYGEKVLLTVLFNRTQPLIRYEVSDSIRFAPAPCLVGDPYSIIESIQGRQEDVLFLPSVSGGEVAVHPYVFHTLMDTLPVNGWQVVQETSGLKLLLSGIREGFVEEAFIASLRQQLARQGVIVPIIQVQQVSSLPRTPLGKARLVVSNRAHPAP